ncbi:MFS transporter [Faecalibacterium sp.]|uniref:MFS transporter n=1 Tax=Faecalibacterium sp. TaxID=1971605 RepID=UPI004025243D
MIHLLLAVIYVSFISLGLPDSLLGAAWPSIYQGFGVPVSYSGVIFCIISVGTVISSLKSDRLTRRFGAGGVTAISVAMTAAALFGFSVSNSFWALCLWAVPYGLGAGSVDAALNNYVALHFASRHMSWLHCMWGIGASVGPYIMGAALSCNAGWHTGYRIIGVMQLVLTIVLVLSLPLWKTRSDADAEEQEAASAEALTLKQIFRIPGVKAVLVTFFCYCSLEQTTSLWASSYLVLNKGIAPETAASFASLFFVGITAGRALSGFLTLKFNDTQMIRMGLGIIAAGVAAFLLPFGDTAALAGLLLVGLGCAPIYPSIIHATPSHFGADRSQAIIGVQMASAYVGNCLMPPLFGVIANHTTIALFPYYLLVILILMGYMHEMLQKETGRVR